MMNEVGRVTMETLYCVIYSVPGSILVRVMTVVSIVVPTMFSINEARGKHLQYSKLAGSSTSGARTIGGKLGMTVFYFPSFLLAVASFFIFPVSYEEDSRFFLLRFALSIHFLKRLLETWFVHKFSGSMTIEAALTITSGYVLFTLTVIYAQYLSLNLKPPSIDLNNVGSLLFVIATGGNLYHHYLLSTLRRKSGDKEYKIPKGGLFGLIICPHYMFEALTYWSLAMVAQTLYALSFAVGTTVYLMGRSHATRNWYTSKFDDFPAHVKALIPYVF